MTKITVNLQVGKYPSDRDIFVAMQLDGLREREVIEQLDIPYSSPGWMCSSTATIRRTMGARKLVAQQLTEAIVKALGERDLIDGYPKDSFNHG